MRSLRLAPCRNVLWHVTHSDSFVGATVRLGRVRAVGRRKNSVSCIVCLLKLLVQELRMLIVICFVVILDHGSVCPLRWAMIYAGRYDTGRFGKGTAHHLLCHVAAIRLQLCHK